MSALSKTQNKQLIPAETHQTGVCLLTEKEKDTQRCVRTFTIIRFHNCVFVFFHFHHLTRELRRQGWSEPSAWREREVWMLTHRYNVHSDILAWG